MVFSWHKWPHASSLASRFFVSYCHGFTELTYLLYSDTFLGASRCLIYFSPVYAGRMFSPACLPGQVPTSAKIVSLLCFGWLGSAVFCHDAAVPSLILGRISPLPAASVFCLVPRVFLRVKVSSPPYSLHVLSPPSVLKLAYFGLFSWVHVFVNLERLSASGTNHVARFSPVYTLTRLSGS